MSQVAPRPFRPGKMLKLKRKALRQVVRNEIFLSCLLEPMCEVEIVRMHLPSTQVQTSRAGYMGTVS